MFHYARLVKDFKQSEVEGPEVFHFVAVEGTDDWVGVKLDQPLQPEHEPFVRELIREQLSEMLTCEDCGAQAEAFDSIDHESGCSEEPIRGFSPLRMTRRFLRSQGADFVEIG